MTDLLRGKIKDFVEGVYDGPHATPPKAENGPVFLGVTNVTPEGRLDFSETRYISENDFPRWTKRVVPQAGDIVFSYEATLHRYARIPEGFRGCLGRRMALVRPKPDLVDSRFLHYYFLTRAWRAQVEAYVISGATVDRIPIAKFPDFEIALPPLEGQKRIADIIYSYDRLIENNRRRIQLLEESARLLYREWFVHLRFPGHEHVKVLGGVPEGWEQTEAEEVLEINPKEKTPRADHFRYVPMAALPEGGMVVDREQIEEREKPTNTKFRNRDVLFARITPCLENGKTGFVDFLNETEVGTGSSEFIVLRGKRVGPEFVYCLARERDFREAAKASMVGSSGRQRVQTSAIKEYRVVLPPRLLLEQFEDYCRPLFEQIRILTEQNARLAEARDLLLPRLMNGEIAV